MTGEPEEAVECLRRAVAVAPLRIDLKAEYGIALAEAGEHEQALDLLEDLLPALSAQGQDAAVVYAALGDACLGLDRLYEAVGYYRIAIAKEPENTAAAVNLGIALQRLGRHKEAIAAYEAALRLEPSNLSAMTNLGVALQEFGAGRGFTGDPEMRRRAGARRSRHPHGSRRQPAQGRRCRRRGRSAQPGDRQRFDLRTRVEQSRQPAAKQAAARRSAHGARERADHRPHGSRVPLEPLDDPAARRRAEGRLRRIRMAAQDSRLRQQADHGTGLGRIESARAHHSRLCRARTGGHAAVLPLRAAAGAGGGQSHPRLPGEAGAALVDARRPGGDRLQSRRGQLLRLAGADHEPAAFDGHDAQKHPGQRALSLRAARRAVAAAGLAAGQPHRLGLGRQSAQSQRAASLDFARTRCGRCSISTASNGSRCRTGRRASRSWRPASGCAISRPISPPPQRRSSSSTW